MGTEADIACPQCGALVRDAGKYPVEQQQRATCPNCERDELGIVPGVAVRGVHERLLARGEPAREPLAEPPGPVAGVPDERKLVTSGRSR
jgi:hypothetical protein